MIDLAAHNGKGLILLKDIARRQNISRKYLWQVADALKAAKLVVSGRGVKGGYKLAKSPDKINLRQIAAAMGEQLLPVACLEEAGSCRRSGQCAAQDVWRELGNKMNGFLDSLSLQEMVLRQAKKQRSVTDSMYYI
ncbi:MAG: Rrf2 family transcriptional regulator [Candidatus Margulisbacteria bacterium]|jgi:Rrf2 family protein|nr:Rrf2 family transcriptional regulator [Candidatus Margulisiibacteriota bacterium]